MKEDLKKNISLLPLEIQKKICILSWRGFWREFVPITAQIPSWYNRKIMIENMIYKARLNNIHFLHLSFNTLEENKKWILGCQCDFCNKIKYKYKRKYYDKLINNDNYFIDTMPHSDTGNYNKEYYADSKIPYMIQYYYDPLCGSAYEDYDKYAIRTNKVKLEFEI
jgi:hypothetical protein|tara:strand:- start:37 stop:534 length:498 start_codon:yes stop_codon:yes gene_type:complete